MIEEADPFAAPIAGRWPYGGQTGCNGHQQSGDHGAAAAAQRRVEIDPLTAIGRALRLTRLVVLAGIVIAATSPLAAAPGDVSNEAQIDARNDDRAGDAQASDLMANLWSYTASIGAGVSAALDSLMPPAEAGLGTIDALIGDAYYYGHGVSRDYTEAARWYRRAAENSNAMAQSTLGDIYYYGRGVPQDFLEAAQWWQLAADQGVAVAQLNLGVMYANGDGVPQDYVKAHFYTNLAAARLPPGQDRDIAVKNRDIVGKLMNPGQIAEAQRLARIWRPKSPP